MSTQTPGQFDIYQERRLNLIRSLKRQVELLNRLGLTTAAGNMQKLADEVASDAFKVLVLGEFSRGKSTFINALLGQKVLPAYTIPTTAIINEVRWGEQPAAYLYHLPDPASGSKKQRIEQIPVDTIERYVVVSDDDGSTGKPYEKVVLTWPLDLCRDGVEIVDTPGLNADPAHKEITMSYLAHADAVIFVIACDFPAAQTEKDMVHTIYDEMHYEDIFFICNRVNMVGDDLALVKRRLLQLLAPMTRQGERHIYFVDARGALQARIVHDEQLAQASGVPAAEHDLKEFLATEKGRIKLVRPAHALQDSVLKTREAIRDAEQLSQKSLQALQKAYEDAQQPLLQLSMQVSEISSQITTFRYGLSMDITDRANAFFRQIADQPREWIKGWTPQNVIGITSLLSSQKREALVDETVRYLTDKVEHQYKQWQEQTLIPFIESQVQTTLRPRIESRIKAFDAGLERVKVDLVSGGLSGGISITGESVPLWQRVVGGVGGLLLGDIFSAGFGVAFGVKQAAANVGVALGIAIASVAFTGGLSLPFILPALLAANVIQLFIKGGQMNDKITTQVADSFAKHLSDERDKLVASIARAVDEQAALLQTRIEEMLNADLASTREQVEEALKVKQQGQLAVDQKMRELHQASSELDAQDKVVTDLLAAYAMAV